MAYTAASERRKRALADSLKKLMETKSFSKITVNELIQDCGINRKTFYYHFEDIYALLKWALEQDAIEVVKKFDLITESDEVILFIMDYVDENDRFLNNVCNSVARSELKRFFYNDFYEIIHSIVQRSEEIEHLSVSDAYEDFLCRFYTEAIAGSLLAWISEEQPREREQTVQFITSTLRVAIPASLRAYNIIAGESASFS